MKVFISWSGSKSEAVANALRKQLPVVLDDVEPWMSQSDIESGDPWHSKLASELAQTDVGIICLTSENLASPWINFEAGCLAKQLHQSRIIPYLIDVDKKAITGPLSHFQSEFSNQAGTRRIFEVLKRTCGRPSDEVFAERFPPAWHQLEQALAKVTSGTREDPSSEVAISMCYLLLEKGCIREVCDKLAASRTSRSLPPAWIVLAAVTARLTRNRNAERLHREISAIDANFREIAAYERGVLAYARGATETELRSEADELTREATSNLQIDLLCQLCRLEAGADAGEVDFKAADAALVHNPSALALNAVPLAILAASKGLEQPTEFYFDFIRHWRERVGTRIGGYPYVQLLAPADCLLADAIAGANSQEQDTSFELRIVSAIKAPQFTELGGHLHVVARWAKSLYACDRALATLASLSRKWKSPLVPHEVKQRLNHLRRAIFQVAGNP